MVQMVAIMVVAVAPRTSNHPRPSIGARLPVKLAIGSYLPPFESFARNGQLRDCRPLALDPPRNGLVRPTSRRRWLGVAGQ